MGLHQIAFSATNLLGAVQTKTVQLYVGSGQPIATTLENAAGSTAPAGCSAGAVATLRGHFLYTGTTPAADPSGSTTNLNGTRVLVNGVYVPVLYASENRVDLLCPAVTPTTALAIAVETAAGSSNALSSQSQESTPGLFSIDGSGRGQAQAVRLGSLDLAALPNPRFQAKPALPGDTLLFLGTGIGCSTDTLPNLTLKLGSHLVPVTGLQPLAGHAGVCEIAVSIPPGVTGDAVPAALQLISRDGQKILTNDTTIDVAVSPLILTVGKSL